MLSRGSHASRTAAVAIFVFGMSVALVLAQPVAEDAPPRHEQSELAPTSSTLKGAIADSFRLLLLEHSTRIAFQPKTRRELAGPFFSDYARSVRRPQTWNDGDSWGAITSAIPSMAPPLASCGSIMKTVRTIPNAFSER